MAVWKHPTYRTLYIREPIPPELWEAAGKKTYKVSLGTDQLAEARRKYPEALAKFTAYLDGLRNGPRRLTAQDVEGLVGIWYREKLEAWSADPGAAEEWEAAWEALPGGESLEDQQARSRLVRADVDRLLEEQGLIVDPGSRAKLEDRLFMRMVELVSRVEARARGDYSRDPVLDQFPAPPVRRAKGRGTAGADAPIYADGSPTWAAMFDRWLSKATRTRSTNTVNEYRAVWTAFEQHVYRSAQRSQPSEVETFEVEQWRSVLLKAGVGGRPLKRKTVQGKYLAAVSAIYSASQGKGRGFLIGNPVDGAWFDGRKFSDSQGVRPYSTAELAAILRASRNETLPERRWLPWLLVYSGARYREAAQSLASDIRERDGIPYLSINRDQQWKRLKTASSERDIPLHSLLIGEGFKNYVQSLAPDAFLFPRIKPAKNGETNEGRPVTHLREWLATFAPEPADSKFITKPMHSFRHAFEDLLREATDDTELRRDIQGREDGSSANAYGDGFTLRKMREALERIPAFVEKQVKANVNACPG